VREDATTTAPFDYHIFSWYTLLIGFLPRTYPQDMSAGLD